MRAQGALDLEKLAAQAAGREERGHVHHAIAPENVLWAPGNVQVASENDVPTAASVLAHFFPVNGSDLSGSRVRQTFESVLLLFHLRRRRNRIL